jgi:hypothetical protein
MAFLKSFWVNISCIANFLVHRLNENFTKSAPIKACNQ